MAFTRLAFSDALVLEEGIEEEVVDAAHQLLDEYLTPEEGIALLNAFPKELAGISKESGNAPTEVSPSTSGSNK